MCNRYQNKAMSAEVASLFRVEAGNAAQFNVGTDVYPNYPGMVVRVENGERHLQAMNWGFPVRLKGMKPTSKPKPVNNARDDKLLTFMWRDSFVKRRCLIPLTAWAEAEGPKGKMTCTWHSLPSADLFAVAGIWRPTDEWGDCYSMVMVDGCQQMFEVHDRMPVILRPDSYAQWTDGTVDEAMALVRTCDDELNIDRTPELWSARAQPAPGSLL
jgi:putative SOS response-associated peptidase YedK